MSNLLVAEIIEHCAGGVLDVKKDMDRISVIMDREPSGQSYTSEDLVYREGILTALESVLAFIEDAEYGK